MTLTRRTRISAFVLVFGSALTVPLLLAAQGGFREPAEETVEYDSNFAFTRIRFGSGGRGLGAFGGFRGFGGAWWAHDYPTADRNVSAVIDYITNMRVRLDGTNILDLDDPRLFENPVIYVSEPGFWTIRDNEVEHLRNYLLKGGFIIFDDFDGPAQWQNMAEQMARALPEHQFFDIDESHPIFHAFFDVDGIYTPFPGSGGELPNYRAIFEDNDPSKRIIALANHNNDLGEYWEWSAEGLYDPDPTNNAYRLGVNYIVYAMTH